MTQLAWTFDHDRPIYKASSKIGGRIRDGKLAKPTWLTYSATTQARWQAGDYEITGSGPGRVSTPGVSHQNPCVLAWPHQNSDAPLRLIMGRPGKSGTDKASIV